MFFAAVARSRFDTNRSSIFTGKIDIFPFTCSALRCAIQPEPGGWDDGDQVRRGDQGEVQGKSGERGDPCHQGLLARRMGRIVYAQKDSAPFHHINDGLDVVGACTADYRSIKLMNQPVNSPKTNVLDIGIFNSIHSFQDQDQDQGQTTLRTVVDELSAEVRRAFAEQTSANLGKVWTSHQAILQEIMLAGGDNTFKLPISRTRRHARAHPSRGSCRAAPRGGQRSFSSGGDGGRRFSGLLLNLYGFMHTVARGTFTKQHYLIVPVVVTGTSALLL